MTTIQNQITAISKAKREIERIMLDKPAVVNGTDELAEICDGLEDAEGTLQALEGFRHIMSEED
jgi:hypothetical protein